MHRFYVPPALLDGSSLVLPPETARQALRVLRLRPGHRVVLFSGDGQECEAVLEEVTSGRVSARVECRRTPQVELGCRLHAAVAVLKGEKLDWTVQKLTELGACRISLLLTERTVVTAGEERWPRRVERLRRIAQEAAEQCGRVRLPEIFQPRPLRAFLEDEEGAPRLLLHVGAEAPLSAEAAACRERVTLLSGPEGGFTQAEAALALGLVSLGPRVLRAETAAIAAAAVIASLDRG
jgi:16S rRNA (uracil1498-N3)-methyltransferase